MTLTGNFISFRKHNRLICRKESATNTCSFVTPVAEIVTEKSVQEQLLLIRINICDTGN